MSTQVMSEIWKKGTPNWFCLAWIFGIVAQIIYPIQPLIFKTPLVGGFLWIPIIWTLIKFKVWMWSNALTFAHTISARTFMWVTNTPFNAANSLSSWKRFYSIWFKIKFSLFPIWTYLLPWYCRNSTTTYLVLFKRFHTSVDRARWLSFSLIGTFNEMVKVNPFNTLLIPYLIQAGLDWKAPVAYHKREKINITLLSVFSKWLAELSPNTLGKHPTRVEEVTLLCFDLGKQGLMLTIDDFFIHDPELQETFFSAYREGRFMYEKHQLSQILPTTSKPTQSSLRRL